MSETSGLLSGDNFEAGEEFVSDATAWSRYWSRLLDLTIWMGFCGFLLGFLFPTIFLKLLEITGGNDLLVGVILLPAVILIDALCLAAFGQTIGRAIASIRVIKISGERLTLSDAVNRNLQVYVKGLGLGIPLVSLVTLLNAHGKVNAGQETSWDESVETRVVAESASLARTILTALLYILAVASIQIWDMESERTLDREMPRQSDFSAPDPIEEQLRTAALEIKSSLPQKLDQITTLVDVTVQGRTLSYLHEISRRDASDDALRKFLVANTIPKVCKDSQMRQAMDDFNVVYRYSYQLPRSSSPISIEVDRNVCTSAP
jgi:uncharacterized RDD family membrane protein YckC